MKLTTLLLIITIYMVCIVIGMFIEDSTYKLYFYMIIALGTLTFMNIYLTIFYYIKLRNEPGIQGPSGAKGEIGPTGPKGKCVNSNKCGFSENEMNEMLYNKATDIFNTSQDCLKEPSLNNCVGGASEVERIQKVSSQMKMLEQYAKEGKYSRDEFEKKINNSFGNL